MTSLNNSFDFSGDGTAFPAPYNSGASNFEIVYSGNFTANSSGVYTFTTASDDGSMLFIDGNTVVDNNFFQGVTARSGSVSLSAGQHSIVIAFYQGGGGYGLYADVQLPGDPTSQRIPNSLLSAVSVNEFQVASLAGGGSVLLSNNNITIGNAGSGSTSFSGIISGTGTVTKTGSSTQIFAGNNTYTGTTTINQGALVAASNNALGSATGGAITVASGAALHLAATGAAIPSGKSFTLSGSGISGTGAIRSLGGSSSVAGPLFFGAATTFGSDAGTLTLSGSISATYDLTVTGAGNTTISGAISSGLPGLIVGQSNNNNDFAVGANPNPAFGSDVDITTTMANKTGGDGAVIASSARTWASNNTWFYRGQIYFPNNNGNNTGTITFAENVDDSTFLRIDSTQVLNDTVWNTPMRGTVTMSTGWHTIDLRFSNGGGGAGPVTGTGWTATKGFGYFLGSTTSTDGSTYSLLTDPGNGSFLRTAGTSVNLTKTGTGTLTLSAANSFVGATSVQQGTLITTTDNALSSSATGVAVSAGATLGGTGTTSIPATISGKLAPGTPAATTGLLALGSVAFAAGSTFEVNINGTTPGNDFDVLHRERRGESHRRDAQRPDRLYAGLGNDLHHLGQQQRLGHHWHFRGAPRGRRRHIRDKQIPHHLCRRRQQSRCRPDDRHHRHIPRFQRQSLGRKSIGHVHRHRRSLARNVRHRDLLRQRRRHARQFHCHALGRFGVVRHLDSRVRQPFDHRRLQRLDQLRQQFVRGDQPSRRYAHVDIDSARVERESLERRQLRQLHSHDFAEPRQRRHGDVPRQRRRHGRRIEHRRQRRRRRVRHFDSLLRQPFDHGRLQRRRHFRRQHVERRDASRQCRHVDRADIELQSVEPKRLGHVHGHNLAEARQSRHRDVPRQRRRHARRLEYRHYERHRHLRDLVAQRG